MGCFLTSKAAGGYLFLFIQKKFPAGWGVQPVFSGFSLVGFFKGNSEQGCSWDGFLGIAPILAMKRAL